MTGWGDFITDWLTLTAGTVSPPNFRLWAAISLLAGALERRVWAQTGSRKIFPNLYTMLVAPPGVGKFIVEDVRDMWASTVKPNSKEFAFKVAPDNMTKAAMIDALADAGQIFLPEAGGTYTYHSLLIAAEEMEVFMPEYERDFIGTLNSLYNNKELPFTELRRHGAHKKVSIDRAQLNILAGAQPAYMASRFPEDTWATGFARRVIMVYAGEAPFQELWDCPQPPQGLLGNLSRRLGQISQLYGVMQWEPHAAAAIADWHRRGGPPVPQHSKLVNYNRSRTAVFAIKLAIVAAVSRTGRLTISEDDVLLARNWLLDAEKMMPDIFREMIGRSDIQVIEEMHYMVTALYCKKKSPISGEVILEFLLGRVPSEKAQKILQVAAGANYIQRAAGTDNLWVPRPKQEVRGVE